MKASFIIFNLFPVAKMREDNVSVSAGPQGHPKDTISAGLCYTSQLVAVMAHILSISLPKRQCYR